MSAASCQRELYSEFCSAYDTCGEYYCRYFASEIRQQHGTADDWSVQHVSVDYHQCYRWNYSRRSWPCYWRPVLSEVYQETAAVTSKRVCTYLCTHTAICCVNLGSLLLLYSLSAHIPS